MQWVLDPLLIFCVHVIFFANRQTRKPLRLTAENSLPFFNKYFPSAEPKHTREAQVPLSHTRMNIRNLHQSV